MTNIQFVPRINSIRNTGSRGWFDVIQKSFSRLLFTFSYFCSRISMFPRNKNESNVRFFLNLILDCRHINSNADYINKNHLFYLTSEIFYFLRILPLKGLEEFYCKNYQVLQLKSVNRNFLKKDPDSCRDYNITLNFDFV